MSEQRIQQEIRLACSRGPVRLWRNNVGRLLDQQGRMVTFGLCPGSADLIGYSTVTITPEMVGQAVAVFAAVEVKTPTGRVRPEQTAWLDHVTAAGGLAGIARSVEEAQRILGATSATEILSVRCSNGENAATTENTAAGAGPPDFRCADQLLARPQPPER
jgi:hypothetical protein